jgi:hypothetical protein
LLTSKQFDKLGQRDFGLHHERFESLWRQVSTVARNHDVKMSLRAVPQSGVASSFVVKIEISPEESLQQLSGGDSRQLWHRGSASAVW